MIRSNCCRTDRRHRYQCRFRQHHVIRCNTKILPEIHVKLESCGSGVDLPNVALQSRRPGQMRLLIGWHFFCRISECWAADVDLHEYHAQGPAFIWGLLLLQSGAWHYSSLAAVTTFCWCLDRGKRRQVSSCDGYGGVPGAPVHIIATQYRRTVEPYCLPS